MPPWCFQDNMIHTFTKSAKGHILCTYLLPETQSHERNFCYSLEMVFERNPPRQWTGEWTKMFLTVMTSAQLVCL